MLNKATIHYLRDFVKIFLMFHKGETVSFDVKAFKDLLFIDETELYVFYVNITLPFPLF